MKTTYAIPFNKPPYTGNEEKFVLAAIRSGKMAGDGDFTHRCERWFERTLRCPRALLTPSCTQALELAALLIDIKSGDEVIMPSFTFVSTANAFALRGARIVFVDIRPDTMNIDETLIEAAVTAKTKAIVPVHYGGVGCAMNVIMEIAQRHGLFVVEDAAQGMMGAARGQPLGTIGHFGAYSFHETKNYTSGGEGGLLVINDEQFIARAEVMREKGTNRSLFFRGMVDKYSWVDLGSSYLPGELQAAYLWGQLELANEIKSDRLASCHLYRLGLQRLAENGSIQLQSIPADCSVNGHMLYLKARDLGERSSLLEHLKDAGIMAVFHYVPLHTASAGVRFGRFHGIDLVTTRESERLLRLPLFYGMTQGEVGRVIGEIEAFYATGKRN